MLTFNSRYSTPRQERHELKTATCDKPARAEVESGLQRDIVPVLLIQTSTVESLDRKLQNTAIKRR
jgi:hypothetical protein